MLEQIKRALLPLQTKIQMMIGRCILSAVDNSEGYQNLTVTGYSGEVISEINRAEEYGFTTYPFKDAEAVALFVQGNRDQGVVIKVADREYRPLDLQEGEVCIYTDEDLEGEYSTGNLLVTSLQPSVTMYEGTEFINSENGKKYVTTADVAFDAVPGQKTVAAKGKERGTAWDIGGGKTFAMTSPEPLNFNPIAQGDGSGFTGGVDITTGHYRIWLKRDGKLTITCTQLDITAAEDINITSTDGDITIKTVNPAKKIDLNP